MQETAIDKLAAQCNRAKSEDDVKAALNIFLDTIGDVFGLQKDTYNEVTCLQGGRADGIFSNVIFEYKSPDKFARAAGRDEALYGRDEHDRGLFHYLVNFTLESAPASNDAHFRSLLKSKVGVGFDGKSFIFCRFVDSPSKSNLHDPLKTKAFPSEVSAHQPLRFEYEYITDFQIGAKKLILFARSTDRKVLSAGNLLDSFASSSALSTKSIHYLYDLLMRELPVSTRISTLYTEWNRIFGDIYGVEETEFTRYKSELAKMYDLPGDVDVHKALFSLQTYYSIVIKLLIHSLLESLANPTRKTRRPDSKNELSSLFSGDSYTDYYVDNFFETHFFEWFLLSDELDLGYIHEIINELDTYETTASVIKPEIVQDVLKRVYQNLIPKGLRHLMGEYYTPDWLVDFTIEKSGIEFGAKEKILDPACGSGAFLTHIIKGVLGKSKHDITTREQAVRTITKNIVGFDINPIAVISAKANYLLSLGDITQLKDRINIPIYMCDSTLVPTVHAKQVKDSNTISVKTTVGEFVIPAFKTREANDYFLRLLSSCILKDYTSFDEFHRLLQSEGVLELDDAQVPTARRLYNKLLQLHADGKNGFWPVILKNSFAPVLLQDKFDYVIGNPPWITWKAMSDTYRKLTLDIWLSYGIFEKSAYDKITSHDDFAMAVTYVSIDHYLKDNGKLAFVLPQTFVKSLKGGEGFRKFAITRDGQSTPFAIEAVYDLVGVNPFRGVASNRASVYIFGKNRTMRYPMQNYHVGSLRKGESVSYNEPYETAQDKISFTTLAAKPINENPRSPWLTIEQKLIDSVDRYLGPSPYMARKGIEPCGAKGIYLLDINRQARGGVEIENLIERSRLEKAKQLGVHRGVVEKDFVYPMVGGRNFDKWGLNSHLYMVVPHDATGAAPYRGVDESLLKTQYPLTYNWLYYFKDLLLETRIRSGKFFVKDAFPFYRLDNIGEYTFSKYKVLWKEQSKQMTSVVVSNLQDEWLGEKTVVTDSKVLYVPMDSETEAHYLCGVLNARVIGKIIEAYTIEVQKGVDIVKNIRIPKFDSKNSLHSDIASLSKNAHAAYLRGAKSEITTIEAQLEIDVEQLFGRQGA